MLFSHSYFSHFLSFSLARLFSTRVNRPPTSSFSFSPLVVLFLGVFFSLIGVSFIPADYRFSFSPPLSFLLSRYRRMSFIKAISFQFFFFFIFLLGVFFPLDETSTSIIHQCLCKYTGNPMENREKKAFCIFA